jgi:hypothetical protein
MATAGDGMKMVVTLKSGTQIKVGVKEFTIRQGRAEGDLRGIDWTYDDDPHGSSLKWLDISQVAAVHAEREPGDIKRDDAAQPALA